MTNIIAYTTYNPMHVSVNVRTSQHMAFASHSKNEEHEGKTKAAGASALLPFSLYIFIPSGAYTGQEEAAARLALAGRHKANVSPVLPLAPLGPPQGSQGSVDSRCCLAPTCHPFPG